MSAELHPDERPLFEELWSSLPKDQSGLCPGAAVADALRRANVPEDALRTLWGLADTNARGSLEAREFYMALRYVALCQKDVATELSPERLSIFAGMPLVPNLTDFDSTAAKPQPPREPEPSGNDGLDWGVALDNAPLVLGGEPASPTPSAQSSVSSVPGPFKPDDLPAPEPSPWVVPTADRERHVQYFGTLAEPDAQTGELVLQGGTAIQVLQMSEQPTEVLATVWDLATFQQTVPGSLTAPEFVAAMHLLTALRQNPQLSLPASMPAELVQSSTAGQLAAGSEHPNLDSPRELAVRAEEQARVEAEERAKRLAQVEAAQRHAQEVQRAASEEEEARRQAEEAILSRSRKALMDTLAGTGPQVAHNATAASAASQGLPGFSGDDDPFGAETSGTVLNAGEAAQPRFPSVSSAVSAPTVSPGADDADLDAAFGSDDDPTAGGSGPFVPQSAHRQPADPWPTTSALPSVMPSAHTSESAAVNLKMKPTSSAPWASPMSAAPAVNETSSRPQMNGGQQPPVTSERLQVADAENLHLRTQISQLSAESSQLQATAALEAIAAQRESENEELRSQLSKLTQEVAENTQAYQTKVAEGDMAETAQRNLREEVEALQIELHRQKIAIQRQTEVNEEVSATREELLQVKEDLGATVQTDKETLEDLQTKHKTLLKEVKTMEVNLEYEKLAATKLSAEVDRMRGKLDEQSQMLRDKKQAYEGHERQVRQLRDERLLIEARKTQAASGAASVDAQRRGSRQLEAPIVPQPHVKETTAEDGDSDDPFGVSDHDSGENDSNPFGASSDEEADPLLSVTVPQTSAGGEFAVAASGSPFEVTSKAHQQDDPFADARDTPSVSSPFDTAPPLTGPTQVTNAMPLSAAQPAAGPFSSAGLGIQQLQVQDHGAAGDHDNPFVDDGDPFADDGDDHDPFADSAGPTVPAPTAASGADDNPFATGVASGSSPAGPIAAAGAADNPFGTAGASASGTPFGGLPGTGFNPFA